MSFGSQSGRTRSGSKSFSNREKKLKRKKQDFHNHKRLHEQPEGPVDLGEVRARTLLTLERLGRQVLSTEPGGYDLEHWIKSLNSLLDDFQEKLGDGRVTTDFLETRERVVGSLAVPKTGEIESEMESLAIEESESAAAVEDARSRSAERLSSLKEQRAAKEGELEEGRERLVELRKSNQSRGLFSRVLRSAPSTEEAEAKLAGLEAELRSLDEEIERSQRARAAGEGDPALLEAQRKLEAARARLAELESAMQASLQLASEREAATKALAEAISAMGVDAGAAQPHPA
ncbi:MAG: hypothetical protein JRM86_06425 [Nitrososphaerota archaeon]|nr:hypothetical protein [Nitrososphaerota archaeon]